MGLFDSPMHILIVLVVLVLLFGSAKLPKLAKSLGESMRIFKGEAAKLHDEDDRQAQAQVQAPVQQQPLPAPPPVQAQQPVAAQQPVQDPQHTNQPS